MQKANGFIKLLNRRKNQPKNLDNYARYLADFAAKCLEKSSAQGYILGISGGVDSALALAILTSNPKLKVLGVFIDIESQKMDLDDAKSLQEIYKFEYKYINLTSEYKALVKVLGISNNAVAKANLKVRLRTTVLYALAQTNNLLTVGTTNAAERLVGYYTKFGDNACDINLLYWFIASLYLFSFSAIIPKP